MISKALGMLLILAPLHATFASSASSSAAAIIQLGVSEDGRPTQLWMATIESRLTADRLSIISDTARLFSAAEKEWLVLFRREIPRWTEAIPRLTIPFEAIPAPETVTILIGNQGGDDGFTHGASIICLDLSSWARSYGPASDPANVGRVHRILSHEYTHLLSRAWAERYPPDLSTPFCRALFTIYFEGLGNYYSLSERWYQSSGLSEPALDALEDLGPIFVDRLIKLKQATPEQEEKLREGMTAGPFHKKWGALPAALWLRKEAGNEPMQLQKWVKAGPCGMLNLAREHLPEHLGDRLQGLECDCLASGSH